MAIEEGSTFDCPDCEATAPSTAVPYDTLGYAMCPACDYAAGPPTDASAADATDGGSTVEPAETDDATADTDGSTDDAAWWVE